MGVNNVAKKILVACGTGVCTSTIAINKLKKALEEAGKLDRVSITQCKVVEVASKAPDYNLIICTTQISSSIKTPVINGLPFLTGVGMDKLIKEVLEKLEL
ncbi:PTS sugar transporter subunit IIB [Clostridioides sp. ZZV15-6597]|uniref:PTS sugar transporter subunit IIB n=1 Tax=Clostridioides sp. ZZV15-6597 TaxID=2811500 RepID=UPI001DF630BE|nr:PTS sugar transporter subunit IIB [Clostridioides sp. ZZV15-6597]